MVELMLDPAIRAWVFLPIVVITFLIGVLRHYFGILMTTEKKVELQQIIDSQALIRSRRLRENRRFIPRRGFLMRRQFFNNDEKGFFKTRIRATVVQNPMEDPTAMVEMLKGNIVNVLPMIVIGGWINWTFSGFVTTKVPFPLTLRFKPMLQRGVELVTLDPAWVSSVSWYFLNIFGLRSTYTLFLGANNGADQTRAMEEQINGAAQNMSQDPRKIFKSEWEALELLEHHWALRTIERTLVGDLTPSEEILV